MFFLHSFNNYVYGCLFFSLHRVTLSLMFLPLFRRWDDDETVSWDGWSTRCCRGRSSSTYCWGGEEGGDARATTASCAVGGGSFAAAEAETATSARTWSGDCWCWCCCRCCWSSSTSLSFVADSPVDQISKWFLHFFSPFTEFTSIFRINK